jgi:hypothetical protein
MPHQPTAPPGTRFFARVDRFHCECPSCGALIVAAKDPRLEATSPRLKRRRGTTYNPISSVLHCWSCRTTFGVGLLLWPLGRGGRKHRIPADHQPTRRQLRELAQYSCGIWAAEIKRQGDSLNVAIDQECTCTPPGWSPGCPVHGWEAFMDSQNELPDLPPPPVEPEDEEP